MSAAEHGGVTLLSLFASASPYPLLLLHRRPSRSSGSPPSPPTLAASSLLCPPTLRRFGVRLLRPPQVRPDPYPLLLRRRPSRSSRSPPTMAASSPLCPSPPLPIPPPPCQPPALRLVFDCGAHALKKGPWTPEEDKSLREYVEAHGEGNWDQIQRNAGLNWCGKNCRLRWPNHLRPDPKKGPFDDEEEQKIIELHAMMGNKWAQMAACG